MNQVEDYLKSKSIDYILHQHKAVYTSEEAEKYCGHIPGIPSKNLFLRDKKGVRHFLIILPAKKRFNLKEFGELVSDKKISFASPERLKDKLGLTPGSVSPFGLLNDKKNEVEVYLDKEVYNANIVSFHPNQNTATLELSKEMFHKFLDSLDRKINII